MKHPDHFDTTDDVRKRMSHVKLKNGTAETLLAKALWHRGFRYRKNYKKLPGSPDIAITRHKIAIFVDGEFWHGKDWEMRKQKLKNNRSYWIEKIEENIKRDARVDDELKELGWTVYHFWSKDVEKNVEKCAERISSDIDILG